MPAKKKAVRTKRAAKKKVEELSAIPPAGAKHKVPESGKLWEVRSSAGRKPIFSNPDELWDACCEYFEWVYQNPLWEMRPFAYQGEVIQEPVSKMRAMTIASLCIFLDICEKTWWNYKEKPEFLQVVTRAEKIIYDQKFTGASADLLNPNIIARDLGLKDQTTQELTGKDGGPINIYLPNNGRS